MRYVQIDSLLLRLLTLTWSQIQAPIDVDPLLNAVTDYVHFVTEFFNVICQSGPHIYHSALLLAPPLSVVQNKYSHQISSPVPRIVTGVPISWDSCTASAGDMTVVSHAAWSPCGQLIAAGFGDAIQILDSNTLERVSILSLPNSSMEWPNVSLTFSPNGCLLACTYLKHTPHTSLESLWMAAPELSGHILSEEATMPRLGDQPLPAPTFIWDVQTGTIIYHIKHWEIDKLVFSGNYQTITLLGRDGTFRRYDGLKGTCTHKDKLVSPPSFVLDAHWIYEKSFQFPAVSKNDRNLVVNIQEFQPTSTPPLSLIESFIVPPHDGEFSFSSVSNHASFTTKTEVIILNLRDLRILLQVGAPSSFYSPPGLFSSNGCFFACGTEQSEICIWKNTSTNYVPWCNLRPRLPFRGFSFSPTKSSILTWGNAGIQLLEPDNHPTNLSPKKLKHYQQYGNHLVAYSADGTHIITAQQEGSIITVLDALFSTPKQILNTNMPILDIKIINNTIFVAGRDTFIKWHLKMGRIVCGSQSALTATGWFSATLSSDCSHIAFTDGDEILLCSIQAQRVLCRYTADDHVMHIRFSPDGHKLWFTCMDFSDDPTSSLGELEVKEDGNVTTKDLSDTWLWVDHFSPCGLQVGWGSEWVVDSKGNKLLWLPLSWRTKDSGCIRWDGNFLAFVDSHHLEPIIIEFQL